MNTPDTLFDTLTDPTVAQYLNLVGARIDVTRWSTFGGATAGFDVVCNGCGHLRLVRPAGYPMRLDLAVQHAKDEAVELAYTHAARCERISTWQVTA